MRWYWPHCYSASACSFFRDVVLAMIAPVAFCVLASAGYVLNDIADRDTDRLNPEKCDRPLARGDLTVAAGWVVGLSLEELRRSKLPTNQTIRFPS